MNTDKKILQKATKETKRVPIALEYCRRKVTKGRTWLRCEGWAYETHSLKAARRLVRLANRAMPKYKFRIAPVQPMGSPANPYTEGRR